MARIPEAELERLKSVPLAGLIAASGVVLSRQGADLAGLCPLHDDREPSLKVTEAKNRATHMLAAPISAMSRPCSAMPAWPRPSATPMSPSPSSSRSMPGPTPPPS